MQETGKATCSIIFLRCKDCKMFNSIIECEIYIMFVIHLYRIILPLQLNYVSLSLQTNNNLLDWVHNKAWTHYDHVN